jgi:hypothetical protein
MHSRRTNERGFDAVQPRSDENGKEQGRGKEEETRGNRKEKGTGTYRLGAVGEDLMMSLSLGKDGSRAEVKMIEERLGLFVEFGVDLGGLTAAATPSS